MDRSIGRKSKFGASILKTANSLNFTAGSKVGFIENADELSKQGRGSPDERNETKMSVIEQYQIEDSPWTDTKTQHVDFDDYKARIKGIFEKEQEDIMKEKNRLGDKDRDEEEIQVIDKATEEERDKKTFDDYLKKGLINIRNLVLKNPLHRTPKENEFLILYLKHQYEVFYDIDKASIEMFVQRLSFDVYKPGEVVRKAGQLCQQIIMFIDGEVDAVDSLVNLRGSSEASISNYRDGAIKTFKQGMCIGEECFENDNYRL